MNQTARLGPWKKRPSVQAPAGAVARRDIKAGTARLIKAAGGLDPLAVDPAVRARRSMLSNYQNIHRPECAPIDVIVSLEDLTGRADLTALMCRRRGGVFVPVVPAELVGEWGARTARIAEECSDVFARIGEALADDGRIDAGEAGAVRAEIAELIAVLAGADGALAAVQGKGRRQEEK